MWQARYYLNGHNKADPRFGAIAFMVAAYEGDTIFHDMLPLCFKCTHANVVIGGLFGASSNWYWDGDFAKQSQASWTREPLGLGSPPQMLDKHGCGWKRTFASGASVFLNLCSGNSSTVHPQS